MVITDFIAEIGLSAVKDKITDTAAEAQVKERITDYLDRQQALNYQVSQDEEVDLEGLAEYICSDMIEDVKLRLFGDKKERGAARTRIMEKTGSFASANTALSAKRTLKIVGHAVDVLRDFYRSRINRDLLFVAGEIEDAVKDEHNKTREFITEKFEHLESGIEKKPLLSVDNALHQIEKGNISDVEDNLGTFLAAISVKHDLYPYYSYGINAEKKLVSIPRNDEARRQYPENYKIKASDVMLGNQPVHPDDKTLFDRAYRHQQRITFKIQNIQRYLGDFLDPAQSMTQEMIGKEAVLQPPEFPPAFPCSVRIGEETVVPYLLLRTKEILDDNSFIITNDEQENYHFHFYIVLSLGANNHSITITAHKPTNLEYLHYLMLMKRVVSGEAFTIFMLKQNEPFIQGKMDQPDVGNYDERINLFRKITIIEQFFNTTISVPESITYRDYKIINQVFDLFQGGYISERDKFVFSLTVSEEARTSILGFTDDDIHIAYAGTGTYHIFEQPINIPVFRETDLVRVENLTRLKEKISVLDDGDQLSITFLPGTGKEKCRYIDKVNIEGVKSNYLFTREKEQQMQN
ncbi:MAG: hypothetical protein E7424_01010 [Ruminococcaceae bacterium]|nr:hypothetical protein [Oscillospiraceae bacterium]